MIKTSVVALFCEDIRSESQNRHTIIGLFPDNITIARSNAPPRTGAVWGLPKLCVFARLNFDPLRKVERVSSKLINPDGSEINLGDIDQKAIFEAQRGAREQNSPIAGLNIVMQSAPFAVPTFGRVKFEVTIDGDDFLCAALNILPELPKA